MKKHLAKPCLILISFLFCHAFHLQAQPEEQEDSTPELQVDRDIELFSLNLGLGSYLLHEGFAAHPFAEDWAVRPATGLSHVGINFLSTKKRLGQKSPFFLSTALTIDLKKLYFGSNVVFDAENDNLLVWRYQGDEVLRRNRLRATYLTIPIQLRWENRKPEDSDAHFAAAIGFFGSVRLSAMQKYLRENGNNVKIRDDYFLNRWQAGVQLNLRWSKYEMYGQYSLTPFFHHTNGGVLPALRDAKYVAFGLRIFK